MSKFYKKIIVFFTVLSLLLFQIAPYQTNANAANEEFQETKTEKEELGKFLMNQHQESTENNIENKEELRGIAIKDANVYAEPNLNANIIASFSEGTILSFYRHNSNWFYLIVESNGKEHTGYLYAKDIDEITNQPKKLEGITIKQPVAVYEKPTKKSKILKSYNFNQRIFYYTFSSQWFKTTIDINGNPATGYIYKEDVGKPDDIKKLRGIAIAKQTNVYSNTNRNSKILKTYKPGDILEFYYYDNNWFITAISINGNTQFGFIHSKDVETAVSPAKQVKQVVPKQTIYAYETASTQSKKLKSYSYGQILTLRTFTSSWYEISVNINGKTSAGYIRHADVKSTNTSFKGYAISNPTYVYSSASKNAKKLKSYKKGHILKYKPYQSNWFAATVIVNGKTQTGYIYANDVSPNAPTLTGYAAKNPTYAYSSNSKSSKKLKSYQKGRLLKFKPFDNTWYQATVSVNGKTRTGYFHKNDITSQPPAIKGYALSTPTYVYSKPSKSSKKLKKYTRGRAIQYRPYNTNWYKVTVIVKGKKQTGYIHVNDAGIVNPHKMYTYTNMVSDIKKLKNAYPELISYKVVGKSEYGRDIYAISIGKGKATAFINGSHHAREWLTTNLNMYMIEQYAKAYERNSSIKGYNARKILNETTIWFIPMVNPDGVTLQQFGLQAFPKSTHKALIKMNDGSKNFKRWKANAKGVDLNRQYNAGWKTIKNNPGKPYYQNYKGKAPHTASETKAVLKLVNQIDPQMAVSYHSSGRIIYWNYDQPLSNYYRDHAYAKQISKLTGYALVYYPRGYIPSGGGFTDWFIHTKKRPAFTPEISRHVGPTNVPVSSFPTIWRENQAVGLYVAQESAKLYKNSQRK